eukprot:CAMPEP_0179021546 /NCGR_PEP_ID=MMETSP0796-20121207/5947_1 /TAXON_ID=73915 /ORGANISM="Pyrodinium bahamense, Strain pbaha01" /LENGTH=476 /DNA_ID=CAMNT_0020717383 /DNA_START=98 /DNA_END=1528 /DNA_ORIENTATION=-
MDVFNQCQKSLEVEVRQGSVITPSDSNVQRVKVNGGSAIRATVGPGERARLCVTAECIDPHKAYPRDSLMHANINDNLRVSGQVNSEEDVPFTIPLGWEVAGWLYFLGKPSKWSPYQLVRFVYWSLPLMVCSHLGCLALVKEAWIWGAGFLEDQDVSGVKLKLRCELFTTMDGMQATVVPSNGKVTITLHSSSGGSFSEVVALPAAHRKNPDSSFELIHESVTFNAARKEITLMLQQTPTPSLTFQLTRGPPSERHSPSHGSQSHSQASSEGSWFHAEVPRDPASDEGAVHWDLTPSSLLWAAEGGQPSGGHVHRRPSVSQPIRFTSWEPPGCVDIVICHEAKRNLFCILGLGASAVQRAALLPADTQFKRPDGSYVTAAGLRRSGDTLLGPQGTVAQVIDVQKYKPVERDVVSIRTAESAFRVTADHWLLAKGPKGLPVPLQSAQSLLQEGGGMPEVFDGSKYHVVTDVSCGKLT